MHRVTTTNPKTILTTSKARSNDRDGFHRINIEQANTIPVTFGSNKSFPFAGWSATIAAPFLFPDSDFGVPDSSSGSTSLDEELSAPSFILVLSGSTTHCDAPDAPEGDDAAEVFRSFGIRMRCKAVLSGEDFPSILSTRLDLCLMYIFKLQMPLLEPNETGCSLLLPSWKEPDERTWTDHDVPLICWTRICLHPKQRLLAYTDTAWDRLPVEAKWSYKHDRVLAASCSTATMRPCATSFSKCSNASPWKPACLKGQVPELLVPNVYSAWT